MPPMFSRRLSRPISAAGGTYDKPVIAQAYCPLEVLAEGAGENATEKLVSGSLPIASIGRALNALLDDGDGERALKKALHIVLEERMRSMAVTIEDPREWGLDSLTVDPGPHPLDSFCAVELGRVSKRDIYAELTGRGWRLKIGLKQGLKIRARLLAGSGYAIWRAIHILVTRGTRRTEPTHTVALLSNFWAAEQFEFLADAAIEAGLDAPGQMLMLVERAQKLPRKGYDFLYPERLKIPALEWARHVLFPTWIFAAKMVTAAFRWNNQVPFVAFEGIRIAIEAQRIWPIALNVRCQTVSDVVDYLPAIVVKGAIFRKSGVTLVRWPTTQIDTFGCLLSNSPHDEFVESGNYLASAFARNWRCPEGGRAIGQIQSDIRVSSAARVDSQLKRRIDGLRTDKKLLAYFGHSPETGVTPMLIDTLRAVVEAVERQPDWFLVVKSKRRLVNTGTGRTAYMDIISSLPEFQNWASNERIIFVDYASATEEICPTGWLLDIMDLGSGDHGSIVGECVARSRPYLSYAPVHYPTPFKQKLMESGVLSTNIDRFRERLDAALGGEVPCLDPDWAQWAFDPYQDDRALERLASIVLAGKTLGVREANQPDDKHR